jgi:ABC-type Mn2+/Zn2+ transport system ATPase subunit
MRILYLSIPIILYLQTSSAFSFTHQGYNQNTHQNHRQHVLHSTAAVDSLSTISNTVSPSIGVVVGDTKGAALLLEDVAISRGSNQILSDIDWRVERKERWGLIGPNGMGKSTLLGAIIGTTRMDSGLALVAPKLSVGYLRQTAVSGSMRTVFEEAASEMHAINDAKKRMELAETAVINGDTSEEMMMMLDDASTDFAAAGGWTQEQEVDSVLKGLGFRPEDSKRLCSEFSGGWQMRIALARLLLSKPNVLLLDEPSNHVCTQIPFSLRYEISYYHLICILVRYMTSVRFQRKRLAREISCSF